MSSIIRILVNTTVHHHAATPDEKIPDDGDQMFRRLDSADGKIDGHIDTENFLKMMAKVDQRRGSQQFLKLQDMVEKVDVDKDGTLDRKEFKVLLQTMEPKEENNNDGNKSKTSLLRAAANAERFRWCPPPWFTLIIIIAQISFFIFHITHFLWHPDHQEERAIVSWRGPYPLCSTLVFNPSRRHELWRYLSYFLVHAGLEHLCINVFLQLLVGLLLEMSNGWVRVALIYLAGILAGSLGTSAITPTQYLAGSSAAGFALVGAHVASMLLNWKEDKIVVRDRLRGILGGNNNNNNSEMRSTRPARNFRMVRLAFAVCLCLLDFCRPLYDDSSKGEDVRHATTSYSAHVCGLCTGFLIGVVILRNRKVQDWERLVRLACTVVLCGALFAGAAWGMAADYVVQWITGNPEATFFKEENYYEEDGHHSRCSYRDQIVF